MNKQEEMFEGEHSEQYNALFNALYHAAKERDQELYDYMETEPVASFSVGIVDALHDLGFGISLLNNEQNVQGSDTRNDDSSNAAKPQIKNIPERIYLQVGNDDSDGDFKDLSQVSWCQDRIYPSDIAYVLAKPQISDECDATKAE